MEECNLLIVSDLHLSEGLDSESGKFSRQEDFLFDDAFARFLRYHEEVREQPRFGGFPWMLIVNGDLFDFLQVVSLPGEGRGWRFGFTTICATMSGILASERRPRSRNGS
jgi:hypothetical protein